MIRTFLCFSVLLLGGCNVTWPMLPVTAVHAPLEAIEGRGTVYMPPSANENWSAAQVASASPDQLLSYYSPILVQQQGTKTGEKYLWSPEDDSIGKATLSYNEKGLLVTQIDTSQPTVYGFAKQSLLGTAQHTQLTYVVWYPRHPRTKLVDIEAAPIDSGVLRITLDGQNQPVFYESVLACGCYHKVFAESWVETATAQAYGPPESGKHFSLEKNSSMKLDWEVAGLVETPRAKPTRPVIFVSAGEHRNIGLHSAASFNWASAGGRVRPYRLAPYYELTTASIAGTGQQASIFNAENDQQVLGADRLEKYIFMWIGTDDAGHPRRDDEILLHFDQAHWNDPANYNNYLRLPPGLL
jgi:hypothetical protein